MLLDVFLLQAFCKQNLEMNVSFENVVEVGKTTVSII